MPAGVGRTGGAKGRWFSKEPSRVEGPKPMGCLAGKGGPIAGPPRRVGMESEGFWPEARTGAVGVDLRVRGVRGREIEGVRG